jgi:hypothetical protein
MSPENNRQKVVKRTDLKRKQIGKGRQTMFYVTFKNFPLMWRRHLCHAVKATKSRKICSALRAFEQGLIFIVLHLL